MKKLGWVLPIGILGLAVLFFALTYLAYSLPPPPDTRDIALADLDGDGDLDAFLANGRNEAAEPNTVLLNDGSGFFRDSGQQLGQAESRDVALADFDRDGDIDALVINFWVEYTWNEGKGFFTPGMREDLPSVDGYAAGIWRIEPADFNHDGRIDLLLTGCCGGGVPNGPDDWIPLNPYNTVWFGTGVGRSMSSGQQFGPGSSQDVALADLDGDGDLDAFTADAYYIIEEFGGSVDYVPNYVWLNDGFGFFTDSGQRLGTLRSYSVALGDQDGDGDADALVGNDGPDEVWWNDGGGRFNKADLTLGDDDLTRYVFLADLDGDGDLDAFLGTDKRGQVWINDGSGQLRKNGQSMNYSRRHALVMGDVNGDGALDLVAGRIDELLIWFNDGTGHLYP